MFKFIIPDAYAAPIDIGTTYPPAINGFTNVGFIINILLPNILTVAGIVALIFVIFAGFKLIADASQGEADKTAKDKAAFTAALIGLIIIFGAYWILTYFGIIVGFNFLNPANQP